MVMWIAFLVYLTRQKKLIKSLIVIIFSNGTPNQNREVIFIFSVSQFTNHYMNQ